VGANLAPLSPGVSARLSPGGFRHRAYQPCLARGARRLGDTMAMRYPAVSLDGNDKVGWHRRTRSKYQYTRSFLEIAILFVAGWKRPANFCSVHLVFHRRREGTDL